MCIKSLVESVDEVMYFGWSHNGESNINTKKCDLHTVNDSPIVCHGQKLGQTESKMESRCIYNCDIVLFMI